MPIMYQGYFFAFLCLKGYETWDRSSHVSQKLLTLQFCRKICLYILESFPISSFDCITSFPHSINHLRIVKRKINKFKLNQAIQVITHSTWLTSTLLMSKLVCLNNLMTLIRLCCLKFLLKFVGDELSKLSHFTHGICLIKVFI